MTIFSILALAFPSAAFAEVHDISPDDDSLTEALAKAVDGDELSFAPGAYGEITLDADRALVLRPAQADAEGDGEQGVSVRSIRVVGASTRAEIRDMSVRAGAYGVDIQGGSVEMTRVRIHQIGEEEAPGFGLRVAPGAVFSGQDVSIQDVTSTRGAIQIAPNASFTLEGGAVIDNRSIAEAGGAFIEGGTVRIADVRFENNTAAWSGGAVVATGGNIEIEDVSFDHNSGGAGGAVFVDGDADVQMSDVSFVGNAAEAGGHIYVAGGELTGARGRFADGSARMGGAFAMEGGTLTFFNTEITGQASVEQGAVAYVADGDFSLVYGVMDRNSADIGAGVAQAGGDVLMRGFIATNNRGEIVAAAGGTTTFDHSIVWNNESIDGATLGFEPAYTVIEQPPGFVAPQLGDYALASGSAGLDRGVAEQADLDGTPSDYGMYGGPLAWPLEDADGDGYTRGRDCDDSDATINEGMKDRWYDGIDANCDRMDDFDQDGDGFSASPFNGSDCDDTDAAIYPGADEISGDMADQDCDGIHEPDMDGDGWGSDLDCDDDDAQVSPDGVETWYDGIDADCMGDSDFDRDGDGYDSAAFGGEDCDDADPFRSPGTAEIAADGIDQDCDGADAAAPTRDAPATAVQGEPAEDDSGAVADAFPAEDSTHATTTGCSTAGGAGGTGLLALLGGLVALFGRRRD